MKGKRLKVIRLQADSSFLLMALVDLASGSWLLWNSVYLVDVALVDMYLLDLHVALVDADLALRVI